ncbi:MAG: FAD-dependent monooxygenase [Thermoanaerobaculia bacterium]
MIDVVVVGGGPVGLAAAIAARLHGLSVRLVERQRPPIDKACGEGLMPAGVRALAVLGVLPPPRSLPFRGIRYLSDGVVAEADFPDGPGRGIRRTELHGALGRRAEEVGVELCWGTRVESARAGEVCTAAATWPCRFVVGADGLRSALRRTAGLGAGSAPAATADTREQRWNPRARFGVSRHLRLAPWSERVEVTFGDGAEAYVTPLAADEVGVALLWSGGKGSFDDLLTTRFPADLAQRLAAGTLLGRGHGAGPLLQPTRGAVAGERRIALVGDAAGYVDALTGEGLTLGFEGALALGEALAAGDLALYARRLARLAALPNGLTRLLLVAARRPWLRRRLVAALAADPALFGNFLGLLGDRRPLIELRAWRALRLCGRLVWPVAVA